ncbi:hypothetical protein TrRE_jg2200, partial [Triparma retinervis]
TFPAGASKTRLTLLKHETLHASFLVPSPNNENVRDRRVSENKPASLYKRCISYL